MQVTIKVEVPSSNAHPPKISGQVIVGLSGTRSDSDFFSDPLDLAGATTERGAAVEVPDGSHFVVVVQRVNHHACDLRVLLRADGGHGEAALDPSEQTRVAVQGASVVALAKPESKWGASWGPLLAVLKDLFPVTRKRPAGARALGPGRIQTGETATVAARIATAPSSVAAAATRPTAPSGGSAAVEQADARPRP